MAPMPFRTIAFLSMCILLGCEPTSIEPGPSRESAPPGVASVLQVARDAGIEIPTLCDHPALEPVGGCRLCLVEVEKRGKRKLTIPPIRIPYFDPKKGEYGEARARRIRVTVEGEAKPNSSTTKSSIKNDEKLNKKRRPSCTQ